MRIPQPRLVALGVVLIAGVISGRAFAAAIAPPKVDIVYSIKPDLRLCLAPACGGWWVTPVNTTTLGLLTETLLTSDAPLNKPAAEYVASLEFGCVQWSAEQISRFTDLARNGQALLSGRLLDPRPATTNAALNQYRAMVVQGAFLSSANSEPAGSIYSLKSTGIVCVTSPCPSFQGDLLNTNLSQEIHELSFAKTISEAEQGQMRGKLPQGVVVSATQSTIKGPAGEGVRLDINQVFWPYPVVHGD